ncbi:QacE family quaternary ammonium compound efflux SMR transporter [Lederbergia ruris]|uniref:QacE family quaternary ammonium compound efflux SMR transporter n=1 Tax=Lederbergia ruris TaxID=217495 RepID=A0ABQ4KN08_9BACI|nr:multidrug efflux SMR transporter [Lederbergia ruris]GIN58783.1 QacE family quaternary ammonium compound efflux SMR transporter [Lederbergia ruris]
MGWVYVMLAAISEIVGTMGLKMYSQKKTWKSGSLYLGGFGASFVFLYSAFHYLQVSVAYAVWIGIGTAGAVLVNMIFFDEPRSRARLISVALIVIGVTGLKAVS